MNCENIHVKQAIYSTSQSTPVSIQLSLTAAPYNERVSLDEWSREYTCRHATDTGNELTHFIKWILCL